MILNSVFGKIWNEITAIKSDEFNTFISSNEFSWPHKVQNILSKYKNEMSIEDFDRINEEIFGWGPLKVLFDDGEITEILVNGEDNIWFEKSGRLHKYSDQFFSAITFKQVFNRICDEAAVHLTSAIPFIDGKFKNFRFTVVGNEITKDHIHISFRRHPENPWTIKMLEQQDWAKDSDFEKLLSLICSRKNFLVVGGTGSGKTSVCNALLQTLPENERVVVIEDSNEIRLPNKASTKILTRIDPNGELPNIDQEHLVKRALRLRPDRIVLGEIRAGEAKDLLMALATGHGGSFATLHADDAAQALLRLEMLIQLGAPQWNLTAIRRLIQMSLQYIIVTKKTADGHRRLHSIYKLTSLEENGFLMEAL